MKYLNVLALFSISLLLVGCGSDDDKSSGAGPKTPVYAFQTDLTFTVGSIKTEAPQFNNYCSSSFGNYAPAVTCTNFYSFIGRSSTSGLKSFIATNSLDAASPVKLIDGTTTIASSLQDLVNKGPNLMGFETWSGWPDAYWYSGVGSDGGAGNNCQDFADDTSGSTINVGTNASYFSWEDRSPVCDYYDDYRIICICN